MNENGKLRIIEPIAFFKESTVVAEYSPEETKETAYQTEAELEKEFIKLLQLLAYEYLPITSEKDLVLNLRKQLEKLNNIHFTDNEWEQFFSSSITSEKDSIIEKTQRIHDDHIQILKREDGSTKNIFLIDKNDIHNNSLQVINQYEAKGKRANRYDVTILVNGLPMVHVELKRRGVILREAFNQINRYKRESFWAGSGLFEYVQLFVISNGTLTKYYSNTVRDSHLREQGYKRKKSSYKKSNSFAFTSWWTDEQNNTISELKGFTKTFFSKHSLLNILTRYCVFDVDKKLLVLRPYQIAATEKILQRIAISTNHKQLGSIEAGGYIWHTTGSGKTLTSFKVAQLASTLPEISKVLFVVDRKDLDYQTIKEYDRFQKGAANSNRSTAILQKQLENTTDRIIVTTIQKLSRFVIRNNNHPIFNSHVVLIFDECHRSQFGAMHTEITRKFKKYHLFGFTGTPIFSANTSSHGKPNLRTTEQAFGDKLHSYTIVDAVSDKNVLPFRIDYNNTVTSSKNIVDQGVTAIDTEEVLLSPDRISQIVRYIRDHFDQKTRRTKSYRHSDKILNGFNSLFATASIDAAKRYYSEFASQQRDLPESQRLKIGLIYSLSPHEEEVDGILGDEEFETDRLNQGDRDFLESSIDDYNVMFKQNFDTGGDNFQNYYKDVSQRLRDRELDMLIVVNMFLTGFDATTLNTLWIDKNLRYHGLLQAFSRTNRILNSVKSYGNIISFRDLEQNTKDALSLFGNKDASGIVLLKTYTEYYEDYQEKINILRTTLLPGDMIIGEEKQKEFIKLYGAILRLKNILTSFDEFAGNEILSDIEFQNYQGYYLELRDNFRRRADADRESVIDDVVFEIELIKQVEINVDYILMLVEEYLKLKGTGSDKEIRTKIQSAVNASPNLRSKKDLIEQFVDSISTSGKVDEQWVNYISRQKKKELLKIIKDENLNHDETKKFIENAFRDGFISITGTAITKILPPLSRFNPENNHTQKKYKVLEKIETYFERFFGLTNET